MNTWTSNLCVAKQTNIQSKQAIEKIAIPPKGWFATVPIKKMIGQQRKNCGDRAIYGFVKASLYSPDIMTLDLERGDNGVAVKLKDAAFNKNHLDIVDLKDGDVLIKTLGDDPHFYIKMPLVAQGDSARPTLFMRIESKADGVVQVYYKSNILDQYDESKIYRVALKKGWNNLSINFDIALLKNAIRFDFPEGIDEYQINEIFLVQ